MASVLVSPFMPVPPASAPLSPHSLCSGNSVAQPCQKSEKIKNQLPSIFLGGSLISARFRRAPNPFATSPRLRNGANASLGQSLAASHVEHENQRSWWEKEVQRQTQEVAHLELQVAHAQKVPRSPFLVELSPSC